MAKLVKSFNDAERIKVKASIMIEGLQGRGKTGLALMIAKILAGDWQKVFFTDTENKSAPLYVGRKLNSGEKVEKFKHLDLTKDDGYSPTNYTATREMAIEAGGLVWIADSISHSWTRQGGVLDIVTKLKAKGTYGNDAYRVWGDDQVVQEKNEIFEIVRDPNIHCITCVRVKEKQGMEFDEAKGKNIVKSLGAQQLQQEGLKYEPDLVLEMVQAGTETSDPVVMVKKSRYPMFPVNEEIEVSVKLVEAMKAFLEEGADPDDIEAQLKQDYIQAVKDYCKKHATGKTIWKQIKKDRGHMDSKIDDIPLKELKSMYSQLSS